jgi:hypothetical protein
MTMQRTIGTLALAVALAGVPPRSCNRTSILPVP